MKFSYWQHEDKFDVQGTLIFECVVDSITEADLS